MNNQHRERVFKDIASRIVKSMRHRLLVKPYKAFAAPLFRRFIKTFDKNFVPGVVVKVDGGLGSQMWQYALGRGAEIASGLPAYYDLTWFAKSGMDINGLHKREYRLEEVFPSIRLNRASPGMLRTYSLHFDLYPRTRRDYDEKILSSQEPRCLGGYYVNARYIDRQGDGLRDEFTFEVHLSDEDKAVLRRIEREAHPVAIHIRRGDYVGSIHDVTTPHYFRKAVEFISDRLSPERAVFFVFSNGMDWSQEVLKGIGEDFVFVRNNDNDRGEVDMFLMSRCGHFVISNSSFSWWPAWLSRRSPDKTVVAPDVWIANESSRGKGSMIVDGWLTLPMR
jgi:hypothetical protein